MHWKGYNLVALTSVSLQKNHNSNEDLEYLILLALVRWTKLNRCDQIVPQYLSA